MQDTFAATSIWPMDKLVNQSILEAGEYVFSSARSFRQRYGAYMNTLAKKKGKDGVMEKPTHGYIWYAKTYPAWQATILDHLSQSVKDGALPDNRTIAVELGKIPELKKYQKKVMPFVQFVKERVEKTGIEIGLKQALDFDEKKVLLDNRTYFLSNLNVCVGFLSFSVIRKFLNELSR